MRTYKKYLVVIIPILILLIPLYIFMFNILPCDRNLSGKSTIIVTGRSSHEIIYMTNGKGINFYYSYEDSIYETGYRDYFRKIPDSEFYIFVKIDSLKPECNKILFDSIYENDSIIIEYVKKHASIDVVVTKKEDH